MKAIEEIDTEPISKLTETFVYELGAELLEVKIGSLFRKASGGCLFSFQAPKSIHRL